jgi:hypothetical protein
MSRCLVRGGLSCEVSPVASEKKHSVIILDGYILKTVGECRMAGLLPTLQLSRKNDGDNKNLISVEFANS